MRKVIIVALFVILFASSVAARMQLSLQDCIRLAKQNNKTLQQAEQEVRKYEADYNNVRGGLFPQISLSGGYQYKRTELPKSAVVEMPAISSQLSSLSDTTIVNDNTLYENEEIIASIIDGAFEGLMPKKVQKENSAFGQVKLDQVIFMGGKLINGINIAGKLYHLQERKCFLVEQDVVYNAIDQYYQQKLAREVVIVKVEALSIAKKHFMQVSDMYEQGLVSEYDMLRAKLEVQKLKPDILRAKKNSALAMESLQNYIGIEEFITLTDEIELPEIEINFSDAVRMGLKDRVELELAELSVEVNKVNLRYEKGNFLPIIGFNAEYNYFGQNSTKIKSDNWGNYYQLGIGFSMPLFTGFSNTSKQAKARHSLKQAQIEQKALKEKIKLDIVNSSLQLKTDLKSVEVQQENLQLAETGLRIAESRYDNQVSTQLEVFDAQLMLRSVKLSYLNTVYETIMSYEKLKKAIGIEL
ncbi:MAG: TolC family protein [Candidatus Cloacimonadota bacterium]|nr:TolC family protein [Candidatus Cloacimonadota bacterium]